MNRFMFVFLEYEENVITTKSNKTGPSYNRHLSVESQISEPTDVELLNTELKDVLPMVKDRNYFKKIEIIRTPPVFIDSASNPQEVQKWLEEKKFSGQTRKKFLNMNGEELFTLSKGQLQQYCGVDEGKRLYHYILLQRNISNYQTTRTMELSEKLAKARQKAESGGKNKETTDKSI